MTDAILERLVNLCQKYNLPSVVAVYSMGVVRYYHIYSDGEWLELF